jgi:hypothetical protein
MDDKEEMDEIKKRALEMGVSPEKLEELEDSEDIGLELADRLADYNRRPTVMLRAAMNVVAWVLDRMVPDEEKQAFCEEARTDLNEIIKAVLTPDSVFEASERRSRFKIIRSDQESP